MTNITTMEKALQTTAEEILAKEGYTKTFYAEGIGGMYKKGNTVIDVTVHAGHQNALMVIDPYIVVRINDDPHIVSSEKEFEELLANL